MNSDTTFIDAIILNDADAVSDLLSQGADPNQLLDDANVRPLHFAAQNNACDVVPLLIEAGADLDACTVPDGETPLDIARAHRHDRMVMLLLAYTDEEPKTIH